MTFVVLVESGKGGGGGDFGICTYRLARTDWLTPLTPPNTHTRPPYTHTAGPAGLLGAVEGMSFLAVVAGLVIAGLTYVDYGSIPEAVPVDGGRCSNI